MSNSENFSTQCPGIKESFQLCPRSDEKCPANAMKTAAEYANDLCHKYRNKYPTLLSGKGRQLSSRDGK